MYSLPLFLLTNENNILTRADIHNHQISVKYFTRLIYHMNRNWKNKNQKILKKTKKKTKIYLQKYGHGSIICRLIKNFRYAQ